MKKNKITSRVFEFVLGAMFFIAAGALGISIIKSQIGFAIILFLIMLGVAISITQLVGLQTEIKALYKIINFLRKDNAEKMAIIKAFKFKELSK